MIYINENVLSVFNGDVNNMTSCHTKEKEAVCV